jgi:hypothetical protein
MAASQRREWVTVQDELMARALGNQATVLVLNRKDAQDLLNILVEADLSEAWAANDGNRIRLGARLADAMDVFEFGQKRKK